MNIDMIRAARMRLDGHARRTPLLNSPFLDEIAGRRVWIKPECLQHTGSFKFRGGWSAVSAMDPESASAASSPFRAATMPRAWRSPPRGTARPR
jgi:threonine dehydratase